MALNGAEVGKKWSFMSRIFAVTDSTHFLGKERTEFTSYLTLGKESSYNGQRFAILIHLLGKEFISMVNY